MFFLTPTYATLRCRGQLVNLYPAETHVKLILKVVDNGGDYSDFFHKRG